MIEDAITSLLVHPDSGPCKAHRGLAVIAEAGDPEIDPTGALTMTPVCVVYCTVDPSWKTEIVALLRETIEAIEADPR